jgi:hypothetical protein
MYEKVREKLPEFTGIRKSRVNKSGGNYSVAVMPASVRCRILVCYRSFGETY